MVPPQGFDPRTNRLRVSQGEYETRFNALLAMLASV
jgi:hypothetical protein